MADKDTLNLIKFKFGSFQSIKDLSSKEQSSFYFADDKPAFYNAGLWYGVSSLTSSVNEETGEVTLTINGGLGEDWKDSQPVCTFVAGMTTQQKADLEKAVNFVKTFEDPNIDNTKDVIDKWNEIISFLEGFKDTDVLLDRIVTLETNVTNLQNTTITGGDGLTGGGNLLKNRTIALGTPSTITDSTINEAKGTTHTHAINEASTEQRGIVRLNDSLTSESTDQALTANQGKVLDGKVKGVADLLNDMFEKVTNNGKTYIKTKYGFASDKFVSAGGTDDTESGGSGGVNLTQMWESLQDNNDTFKDRLINVAHIPTLTTGKISDFVSATQAIANTAVANKADKATTLAGYGITDAVKKATKSANVSESCVGYTTQDHNLQNGGLFTGLGADGLYGSQLLGNYVGTGLYYRGKTNGTWTNWKTVAFTDSNVASADMVDGYDSLSLFTSETISDVNAPNKKAHGSWIAHLGYYCSNVPSTCDDGKIVHFSTNKNAGSSFQLASSYYGNTLFFRSGNLIESSPYYLYNKDWKKLAFTDQLDKYLPLTGGTLTGALTVNAPINNTGALNLLGASEVSSTGMAVGTGAKALGSNSRSLSEYSHAGLRTGNSNYPSAIISPYDLIPFTVNGETVYGTPIKANSSLTYKYNGISYTVENTTNYTQVLVLITVGSDFVAGVTYPLNKCTLTYRKGYSLGSGQKIHAISELSDTVRAITIYTWVTGSTDETNFINNFVISNSNKFYAYKGVSLSTKSGNASVASGAYSVASGYASVASHESSKVFATRGISGRAHQTVLGYYNAEDTTSALVVGWGSGESSRRNIFTISSNGEVGFGAAGRAGTLLVSPTSNQIYIKKQNDDGINYIPFLVDTDEKSVRRGSSGGGTTLGTDQYKWFNVFTEALKIADANLTYDIGTLTVDKALKTTSTLTAPQGVFSNYIKIGNATISWNPKGYLVIDEGLASHKFISAGGVVTGDAGGGGGGLSLTDMWVSLSGNIDAYGKSKIHIDHIPLDVILSHDDYENDVADRINTFNYRNSSSFTSAVKALIVADNIPTLEMSKIEGLETTLTNIGIVVQNNYDNLNESISTLQNGTIADHEARIKAIEKALTWQTV